MLWAYQRFSDGIYVLIYEMGPLKYLTLLKEGSKWLNSPREEPNTIIMLN